MANNDEYYDAVVPIEVNGKTIWHKVGTAFPNRNPDKKHKMVISMVSVPLSMFSGGELRVFVFPQKDNRQQRQRPLPRMAPRDMDGELHSPDDVDF